MNQDFLFACQYGDFDKLTKLNLQIIYKQYKITYKNNYTELNSDTFYKGYTIICEYGYIKLLKWLYKYYPIKLDNTMLNYAFYDNHIDIVKWILKNEPTINIFNSIYIFYYACKYGDKEIVNLTLNYKNAYAAIFNSYIPIYNVYTYNQLEIAEIFLKTNYCNSFKSNQLNLKESVFLILMQNWDNDEIFRHACIEENLNTIKSILMYNPLIDIDYYDYPNDIKNFMLQFSFISNCNRSIYMDRYLYRS